MENKKKITAYGWQCSNVNGHERHVKMTVPSLPSNKDSIFNLHHQ